jgi:hypothetical protein
VSTESKIQSGLCHGPGCRREAVVEYFCGERCQAAWDARWGKSLPDDFWRPLAAAFTTAGGYTVPAPQSSPTLDDLAELARRIPPVEVPTPIKLTHGQLNAVRLASPTYPEYARPSTFAGVPVVLVDTVEESTPYQQARDRGAAYPQVASEDPQVTRGWLSRLLGRMYGRGTPQ